MLKGLRSIEKIIIARAYLVITILKLRSNNNFNPGLYRGIRGHSVLLPQNLELLLDLPLSEIMPIDKVVRVM